MGVFFFFLVIGGVFMRDVVRTFCIFSFISLLDTLVYDQCNVRVS